MKRSEVKHIFQKLIMAVVIVSLICPGSLWAKRKGARLVVTRLDGEVVEGRLLKVEENSLLMWVNTERVTINIKEIDNILIERKKKKRQGALIGLLVGGVACYAITYHKYKYYWYNFLIIGGATVGGALVGLSSGSFFGSSAKRSKTYQIKGKAQYEIKFILRKLKKKARFQK